jgi:membrane protease YdiL (CAAX protease family)
MPVMYGGNLIGNMLSALLSGGTAENVLTDFIMGNPLYSFIFTVLLAPFLEEFIFRKQIVDRLGKYGEKTAIVFSAVTFGLFHMNLFQFFYAFGLGLIFAYVYTRTRMLRYPVIMHMIINFMGSVIAPLLLKMVDLELLASPDTVAPEQMMQMLPGMLAYLGYAFLLLGSSIAGLVLIIVRWKKAQFKPTSQQLLPGTGTTVICRSPGMICFTVFCLIMIVLALF